VNDFGPSPDASASVVVDGDGPTGPRDQESQRREFIAAWDALFSAVRRAKGRTGPDATSDLTLSQYQVLAALGDRGTARIGELAEAAGVAPPTVTRMVDGLERRGVLARSQEAGDRRSVHVSLTTEGRELLATKRRAVDERLGLLHSSLSADERDQSVRLLRRLAEAIDEL
jgi:DNA-binding MarR family transcriptional regulator